MKSYNKILAVALVSASLSACADLDTEYLGGYVTTEQKEEVLEQNSDRALAGVAGCFAAFINSNFDNDDSWGHNDFGYTSVMIALDSKGQDMIGKFSGYNWFVRPERMNDVTPDGPSTSIIWNCIYKQIGVANNVLLTIPADTDNDELKFFRAQALGVRAFDYWVLAQVYQFNYSVNPSAPCVPIVTDENMEQVAAEGAPRAAVSEVYDQILADLGECIELLQASGIDPASVMDSKPKRMVSLPVAYGLRARAYLSMHKYSEAAADAQNAINNFSGRPYSRSEVSVPTFTSLDDAAWMWGVAIAETDRVVTSGIINFPSHMGSFNYGYCQYGAWRWINLNLYNSIPDTDVRKGWWLDENYESPNLTTAQLNYLANYINESAVTYTGQSNSTCIMPYTQVKYNSYLGVLGQSTNASDVPLMRVEEMYLTLAEATGMTSPVQGKELLESFVKNYRDPSYSCTATTSDELQEECWRQRRIELWGEGLSYFDVMRMNKGIDRVGALYPTEFTYQLAADDAHLLYPIPLDEITANRQITADDNNPTLGQPDAVIPDEE